MKYLIFFFVFVLISAAADDRKKLHIYQIDKDADISKLRAPKKYIKDLKESEKIPYTIVEQFFEENLKGVSHKFDVLSKDLFIRKLKEYSKKDFLKEYRKIVDENSYSKLHKKAMSL